MDVLTFRDFSNTFQGRISLYLVNDNTCFNLHFCLTTRDVKDTPKGFHRESLSSPAYCLSNQDKDRQSLFLTKYTTQHVMSVFVLFRVVICFTVHFSIQ